MPTEMKFDDLDLREEPPHAGYRAPAPCSAFNSCYTLSRSLNCTDTCCE
jgi:hypothetical protein